MAEGRDAGSDANLDRALLRDQRLAEQLCAGSQEAFQTFFETYFDGLYRFALRRTSYDQALAEEVAQSSIVKAIEKIETYRGEALLFSWLCSICRFELGGHRRRSGRERTGLERTDDNQDSATVFEVQVDTADGPAVGLEKRQASEIVHSILDELSQAYGQILELKYLEGLSVKGIAKRLGISPKAAESQLSRARSAFRDRFEVRARRPMMPLLPVAERRS